jgi:hypothetical protein
MMTRVINRIPPVPKVANAVPRNKNAVLSPWASAVSAQTSPVTPLAIQLTMRYRLILRNAPSRSWVWRTSLDRRQPAAAGGRRNLGKSGEFPVCSVVESTAHAVDLHEEGQQQERDQPDRGLEELLVD